MGWGKPHPIFCYVDKSKVVPNSMPLNLLARVILCCFVVEAPCFAELIEDDRPFWTEKSSQVIGNYLYVVGVGSDVRSVEEGRQIAFENGKREFLNFLQANSMAETIIETQMTYQETLPNGHFTVYRLLKAPISELKKIKIKNSKISSLESSVQREEKTDSNESQPEYSVKITRLLDDVLAPFETPAVFVGSLIDCELDPSDKQIATIVIEFDLKARIDEDTAGLIAGREAAKVGANGWYFIQDVESSADQSIVRLSVRAVKSTYFDAQEKLFIQYVENQLAKDELKSVSSFYRNFAAFNQKINREFQEKIKKEGVGFLGLEEQKAGGLKSESRFFDKATGNVLTKSQTREKAFEYIIEKRKQFFTENRSAYVAEYRIIEKVIDSYPNCSIVFPVVLQTGKLDLDAYEKQVMRLKHVEDYLRRIKPPSELCRNGAGGKQ